MFNQHGIDQNHTHPNIDRDDVQKTLPQQSTHTGKRILSGWLFLLILLVLAGVGTGLESVGITNVVRAFGKGGRPVVTLGLWRLTDVPDDFWAKPFIDGLIQKRVISGYPNDAFRPEQAITRAEFAAMLHAAFDEADSQPTITFRDVPPEFWGASAITNTTEAGFFEKYSRETFQPNQILSKIDALVSLVKGLDLIYARPTEKTIDQVLSLYEDADQIPEYFREDIAAATAAGLIVTEPSTARLNPNQPMTRAEAAASIYQALVHLNQAEAISSPYLVNQS